MLGTGHRRVDEVLRQNSGLSVPPQVQEEGVPYAERLML